MIVLAYRWHSRIYGHAAVHGPQFEINSSIMYVQHVRYSQFSDRKLIVNSGNSRGRREYIQIAINFLRAAP